ncbi:hypothetical protein M408DRAFT_31199 [Serendipita vermifera MAFF 305830]|uniref:Uncharacterized protein n=1 Tax=Serendipita vermifera MAFF 305830 TaxID=933852 RepID=A0A0C2VYR4_SERVB|nr:hypothetical protein M408DRAFT_31199 [Serendipita vermifera MAFF 305830]
MNESSTPHRQRNFAPESLNLSEHAKEFNITSFTVQTPTSHQVPNSLSRAPPPPRWTTPEFLIYAVAFVLVVPLMVYSPVQLGFGKSTAPEKYSYKLSKGWIAGRRMDNSDPQYRTFRGSLFSLCAVGLLHVVSTRVYSSIVSSLGSRSSGKRSDILHRIPFMAVFSVIFVIVLHGTSSLKVFGILAGNYLLAKRLGGTRFGPLLLWIANLVVLFANELNDGYRFGALHPTLAYLDEYRGVYPRWHITFNITMLRLLSFDMDYHWACNREATNHSVVPMNARQRTSNSHPLIYYNPINYVAYALYPPLYIAGPIMTFNDFNWQLRRPLQGDTKSLLSYAFRFIACLLTMEMILHFIYVVAIKDTKAWYGDTPMELAMVGFWNLIVVWLKLLLPWRFFRLWALADGMDPPENMIRCMANNYTVAGFWRGWHRSYNQWLIRYVYVPLGGSGNVILATLVSFTFVALWHDLQLRLLAWGWLITLFIIPEMVLGKVVTEKKFGDLWWYRHARAIGGVGNVLMLMTANLVGFVIGLDGLRYLGTELFGSWSGKQ